MASCCPSRPRSSGSRERRALGCAAPPAAPKLPRTFDQRRTAASPACLAARSERSRSRVASSCARAKRPRTRSARRSSSTGACRTWPARPFPRAAEPGLSVLDPASRCDLYVPFRPIACRTTAAEAHRIQSVPGMHCAFLRRPELWRRAAEPDPEGLEQRCSRDGSECPRTGIRSGLRARPDLRADAAALVARAAASRSPLAWTTFGLASTLKWETARGLVAMR